MLRRRQAFTLLEVLLSIALLSIVMLALNRSVAILRDSNIQLFGYLEESKTDTKILNTIYRDIMSSDGNLTISKDEFTRLCIERTKNSLYELPLAKVCWVVLKEENRLLRIEGNNYTLPVGYDQRVEVDPLLKDIELFDVYHSQNKVLVMLKERSKEEMGFMLQGISRPQPKKRNGRPETPAVPQSDLPEEIPSEVLPPST